MNGKEREADKSNERTEGKKKGRSEVERKMDQIRNVWNK